MATADVVGAYFLADFNDHLIIKLIGESVNIMCKANAEYKRCVTNEKVKPVLYIRLLKALYGCMQLALLWYKTFKTKLQKKGLKLNTYDPCVANKYINS